MDTSRLDKVHALPESVPQVVSSADLDLLRPWRIALFIKRIRAKLVIDVVNSIYIGRLDLKGDQNPDIDLRPFGAEELGVSRRHLMLKQEDSRIVVIDNRSSNGTMLNNLRLQPHKSYPIRHSDILVLGALEMQVEFLINPLE